MATATPKVSDPTFRSYTAEEAKTYASRRLSYPHAFYDTVLSHHSATGGQFNLLLDVGCGPGNAARDVAPSFDRAVGVDAGAAMIGAARELGGRTMSGSEIRFEVSPAEDFSHVEGLERASVDLLISAMAAHWFDMDEFWVQAARVLKPGGTVALWTCASSFCHPSTPNYQKVMETMLGFEREVLAPYELPPNRLSRDMYDNLPLPWTISNPVTAFPRERYVRLEWDREGVLSNGETFFGGSEEAPIDDLLKGLGTASMVTRWREANPELAGTEKDALTLYGARLREALGSGQTTLSTGSGTVILLFKKAV